MARELIVKMTDDLDRTLEATEVREVGYEGYVYALDLTTEHAKELDELIHPWLEVAHEKVKWPKGQRKEVHKAMAPSSVANTPQSVQRTMDKEKRRKIRAWGRRNGYEVADRGYVPTTVIEAYNAAHKRGNG